MNLCICPVCRAPRRVQLRDRLPLSFHLQMAVAIAVFAGLFYLWGGARAAIRASFFYLPLWMAAEFFHAVKTRELARCKACGFDPFLYTRDVKAARKEVEERLQGVVDGIKARRDAGKAQNPAAKPIENLPNDAQP